MRPKAIGISSLLSVFFFFSGFLVILTPLPLIYVSATAGRKNGFLAAALSFSIVFFIYFAVLGLTKTQFASQALSMPIPGIGLMSHFSLPAIELFGSSYFLFFLSIALVLGEAVRLHWGLIKGGVTALAACLLFAILAVFIFQFAGLNNITVSVKDYLQYVISEIVSIQQSAGVTNAQSIYLAERAPQIALFIFRTIPSIIFVFALVAVTFNLLLSRRFIRLPHLFSGHVWDVAAFRIPDAAIWIVIGSILIFFAGHYLFDNVFVKYSGINLVIAMAAVYFFQGLAVVVFFVRRIRVPLFRLLIYFIVILFFQTIGLLIIGLGLADVWVDFRWRTRQRVHSQK